jgi:hypothetical protein
MIACVLCGQPAAPFHSMLCKSCDRENQRRIDRVVWFGGIWEDMRRMLQHMDSFAEQFPDGAALFADAHHVLAETFPRVDSLYREMRRQSDEAGKRLEAAQEKGWAALTEESTFE